MPPILATDLDGTLIPGDSLPPRDPQIQALATLRELAGSEELELVFVTGRHHDSVVQVMQTKGLPAPRWIICDVGTSIFHRDPPVQQEPYRQLQAYVNHLDAIVGAFTIDRLASQIAQRIDVDNGLRLQESEKQGRHKLSFYCDAETLDRRVEQIALTLAELAAPYRIVSSVDPFNGDGLIDLLPTGTDKASALAWWSAFRECNPADVVFAGDSGNDYAALTAGFRAILVGNADRQLAQRVSEHHHRAGHPQRIYLARGHATAGVLEGCRWFGLVRRTIP
jgi:maltooligosyltrehalose trehalohydrolase